MREGSGRKTGVFSYGLLWIDEMKKIFRLASPEKLEIYSLNRNGKLIFQKVVNPESFNLKKVKSLLLSAYYSNWDTTRIENTAYKPQHHTKLFSSKSLLISENLTFTKLYYNKKSGYWAQAWAMSDKLNEIFRKLPKGAVVYPESINIISEDEMAYWRSEPFILSHSRKTGFSKISDVSTTQAVFSENLDGLSFSRRAAFEEKSSRNSFGLILAAATMLVCSIFTWTYSLQESLDNFRNPPKIFYNDLESFSFLEMAQLSISDGALVSLTFNQRTNETTLTFISNKLAQAFFNEHSEPPKVIDGFAIAVFENTVTFSVETAK